MSSQLEDRDFSGLSLTLGGTLGIQNKSELEQFLEQPKARGLVRSAPYQDVFMVIKTVGLADSLELLSLTSRDQRRGFIDLDCWRKDNFHVHSFMEWLVAFIQCGPEETVRLARSVDPELLAYFLKQNIQVHEIDPEGGTGPGRPSCLDTGSPLRDRDFGGGRVRGSDGASPFSMLIPGGATIWRRANSHKYKKSASQSDSAFCGNRRFLEPEVPTAHNYRSTGPSIPHSSADGAAENGLGALST